MRTLLASKCTSGCIGMTRFIAQLGGLHMKKSLYLGAAVMALGTVAQAEQLTVFGPWLGPDQENVEPVCRPISRHIPADPA